MKYYPLFLDITSYKCLVLGAGAVARRKIATLQKAHAKEIAVIDPFLPYEDFENAFLEEFHDQPKVTYFQRNFEDVDLDGVKLAFAATKSASANGEFAKICGEKNILCNVAAESDKGNFIVPSHLDYENLVIALSSSGVSPAFTKALKDDLNNWVSKSYVPYLRLLKILRPLILENIAEQKRPDVFRALVAKEFREELMALLELKKYPELRRRLAKFLPDTIIARIDDKDLMITKHSKEENIC